MAKTKDVTFRPARRDGVAVAAGEHHDVSLTLEALPSCRIVGQVTTGSDAFPVAGAIVRLPTGESATTGADGRYALPPIPVASPHTYVDVTADGFVAGRWYVPLGGETERSATANVVLHRAAPIAGRVLDQHGAPLAGVKVWVQPPAGHARSRARTTPRIAREIRNAGTTVTAPDGTFRFADAIDLDYRLGLHALCDRFEPIPDRPVRGGDDAVVVRVFRLPPGQATLTADIVDHATGAPVNATKATLTPAHRLHGVGYPSKRATRAVGRVIANGLRPGRWRLEVRAHGMSPVEHAFTVKPTDVDVALRVPMGPAGVIEGRVDLGDVAAAIDRKRLFVTLRPSVGRFVSGDGRRYTPGAGTIPIDGDLRFRFNAIPAGREILVRVRAGATIYGECSVRVPFAGIARPSVQLMRGASVRLTSDEIGLASGTIEFRRGEDVTTRHLGTGETGLIDRVLLMPPGTIRWRARLYGGLADDGRRRWLMAEGAFEAQPGVETGLHLGLTERRESR